MSSPTTIEVNPRIQPESVLVSLPVLELLLSELFGQTTTFVGFHEQRYAVKVQQSPSFKVSAVVAVQAPLTVEQTLYFFQSQTQAAYVRQVFVFESIQHLSLAYVQALASPPAAAQLVIKEHFPVVVPPVVVSVQTQIPSVPLELQAVLVVYVEQLALAMQAVPFETQLATPQQAQVVVPFGISEQTLVLQLPVASAATQKQDPSVPPATLQAPQVVQLLQAPLTRHLTPSDVHVFNLEEHSDSVVKFRSEHCSSLHYFAVSSQLQLPVDVINPLASFNVPSLFLWHQFWVYVEHAANGIHPAN
ncbi:unnamed protein product [Paramecium octaurelia]|uniref:Uncharacterized protein n=1 Tax=Paramecium octaurelia TaxID=43137 RepID=A0A8S1Y6R8_PAROT|nr:unnamed protein product [Paramecium octaurelia]